MRGCPDKHSVNQHEEGAGDPDQESTAVGRKDSGGMTAKEYLSQIRKAEIMIRIRAQELQKLKEDTAYISAIRYDKVRVQTSPDGSGISKAVEDSVSLQLEIEKRIQRLTKKRHDIITQIEGLENPNYIELLKLKYIDDERFEAIACSMGYSYGRIVHMHGEALQAFGRKYLGQ